MKHKCRPITWNKIKIFHQNVTSVVSYFHYRWFGVSLSLNIHNSVLSVMDQQKYNLYSAGVEWKKLVIPPELTETTHEATHHRHDSLEKEGVAEYRHESVLHILTVRLLMRREGSKCCSLKSTYNIQYVYQ